MPKKWENNWDKLTEKSEIYNRNRKLLTLGNLAIITQYLNAKMRDSNWEIKKNGINNDGLIAYTSGIETITPYLQLDIWNEESIEKRANDLYIHAISIWKK